MFRLLVVCCMLWCTPVMAATILVFGDSLSAGYGLASGQGWVSLLEKRLAPKHKVVNASQSGETSAGGLARLPQALARHKPDIVVLELGGNDGLRGLPLSEMEANLAQMAALAQRSKAKVVLVGMALPPNYGPGYTARFRKAYDNVAKKHKTAYVPVLVAGFESKLALFQNDGIHPNAQAQPLMAATVEKALRPLLK
ncbi:arylesterase [Aquitalea sp. S1-19]|nr:arylesterase [Aquitalea sp. S1-19]